ncbi:MAG: dockerin type I domain-containing protein [Ruminococcus sp.]|nr:dockerin type I domain-containing protein [Ruminococcus sp.]
MTRIRDIAGKLLCTVFSLLCVLELCPDAYAAAESVTLGDVNSDGQVNAIDASDVLVFYSSASTNGTVSLTEAQFSAADIDRNGFVDASDASAILAYYSHVSSEEFETFSDFIIDRSTSSPSYTTDITSSTYLLYSVDDDRLISYHDIHEKISPASLAKLLTASVVLRYMSPDTVVKVGSEQSLVPQYSSLCLLAKGHKLTVYDLLTGMLMASGNDAAYTLAAATARSVSGREMSDSEAVTYFCGLMNDFAAELNMRESNFVNPDGFDAEGQYTTAADMLRLTRYALTVPQIRDIVGTSTKRVTIVTGEIFDWKNTNSLLDTSSTYYRSDAFGMKTGTSDESGTCLIAAFRINGRTYITLVSGCTSDYSRYDLTLSIINTYT